VSNTIYVVGPTGSGKSFLANLLATSFNGTVVEGSSWIRKLTGCYEHGPEAAQRLAEATRKELSRDPEIALRTLREMTKDTSQFCVISGLRNPTDFSGLWQRRPGLLIVMQGEACNTFEREGIATILTLKTPDMTLTRGRYELPDVLKTILTKTHST
jgi:hypothetical protein